MGGDGQDEQARVRCTGEHQAGLSVPKNFTNQKGASMRLILAEKPSVAVDIAKALGSAQRREGYYQVGQDVVTYAIGHLVSIDDSAARPNGASILSPYSLTIFATP